jgi:ribokinase
VNTDQIGTAAQQSSGAAIVQIDNRGEKQILMVQGANARLAPADVHAAKALLSGAKVVVTQLEVSMEVVATTISLGHALGARVVLDPAPPARLSDDLFPLLSMIRPNADEAEALTGVHVHDRASAKP